MVELALELERFYRVDCDEVAEALEGLLAADELEIKRPDDVGLALEPYLNDGFGFADLMIATAARRAEAVELMAFDKKAASSATALFCLERENRYCSSCANNLLFEY